MNDFIDLPHLPECLLNLPLETIHEIHSHTYHAIKADRQQRGGPVAWMHKNSLLSLHGDPAKDRVQLQTYLTRAQTSEEQIPLYAAPQPAAPANEPSRKFKLGDHVRKTKGSNWRGHVVGTYSTGLTPEGYAVESDTETGSVQIYPAHALKLVS